MNAPAYVAYCAAVAQQKHDEHVQAEERRIAERRSRPGNGGRREGEAQHVVAPVKMEAASRAPVVPQFYRVVSSPEQIVPRSATHMCRGCYGIGQKRDGSTCSWCEGHGRLLSGPDGSEWVWPVPVSPVSEA